MMTFGIPSSQMNEELQEDGQTPLPEDAHILAMLYLQRRNTVL